MAFIRVEPGVYQNNELDETVGAAVVCVSVVEYPTCVFPQELLSLQGGKQRPQLDLYRGLFHII